MKEEPVDCGCGGEARICAYDTLSGESAVYVACSKCDISTRSFLIADDAIEAWNKAMGKRAESSRVERTIKVELNPLAEDIVIGNTTYKVGTRVIAECECGTWLRLGYKYCPSCGARLDWSGNERLY